uniref:Ribonuclease Y n=1 Tax=candidate division WOR-3 bacterium TaxID=2052148 RepID=A0A7C4Y657_UNCW3
MMILFILLTGIVMFGLGFFLSNYLIQKKLKQAKLSASEILNNAKKEREELLRSTQEEINNLKMKAISDIENERKNRFRNIEYQEKRFQEKEQTLDKKQEILSKKEQELYKKERSLESREQAIKAKEEMYTKLLEEENQKLEKIAGLTREQAKNILLSNIEIQAKLEAAQIAKNIKQRAREEAEKEAKEIITQAIQRCSTDIVYESTVSVVPLPNEDMKGRIIGREGRNIRTFENLTGVEVIIDDTPEAVTLSSFDPIKREIAKIALEQLVLDGRIHPARIEEVVAKAEKEVENIIKKLGEDTIIELGIPEMNPEIVKLIGKMKYRTSYGQNLLQHSKEVAYLAGIMAGELGFNILTAKKAGILHDIGKTLPPEYEGTHAIIGAEICQKYGEDPVVVNAIASHHGEEEASSPYAAIVQAADAISGSRPGARRETLEAYIKRLEKLEEIAKAYDGVGKVYAMQAGREIRIIVEPDKVDDLHTEELATEIARKIEKELKYPGQIKVTVIREKRAVDYAK